MSETARWFHTIDALLTASGSREQHDEIERLRQCPVNAESPLQVWLAKEELVSALRAANAGLRRALRRRGLSTYVEEEIRAHVAQRTAFIRWLKQEPGEHVYMDLKPAPVHEPLP